MRVVSLVPAGTEIVAALGAGHLLAGISHECDWPPEVQQLPRVTTTPIDVSSGSGAIDASVRRARELGLPVIGVDAARLRELRPDLILTQDLCEVCAVADDEALDIARAIEPAPGLLSLRARTLDGIFADIAAIGAAIARERESEALISRLNARLEEIKAGQGPGSPRVVCIEWLDPVFLAGHWVPELIAWAGGTDVGAEPGDHSRVFELEDVEAMAPDLVLVAPCGFGLDRAEAEFLAFEQRVLARGGRPPSSWGGKVHLLDGNAYTSRPGPRVVDGAALIAAAIRDTPISGLRMAAGAASPPGTSS